MKTTLLTAMAAMTAIAFTSCDNNKANNVPPTNDDNKKELYSGILPAADAQATVYTLMLDFDDDHNYTDGDYTMVENVLAGDTIDASGLKELAWAYTEGDFTKESKVVDGNTVEYIKLIPDPKETLGADHTTPFYFIVNPDGSLTMVGADLQKSETPGINYTLIRNSVGY